MRIGGTNEKQSDGSKNGFDFSNIKEVVIKTPLGSFRIEETKDGIKVNEANGQLVLIRPVVGNEIDIVLGG